MNQITEDYVSYEIAKLLKEKGFNERCGTAYTTAEGYPIRVMGSTYSLETNSDYDNFHYSMPSQSLALKWLREVHKCYTHISPFYPDMKYNEPPKWLAAVDYNGEGYPTLPKRFDSYEEAVEAAIKYTLENLI